MMLLVTVLAFALAGCGLLLIIRGAVGPVTPLDSVVAELHRPRLSQPPPSQSQRVWTWMSGRTTSRRESDLAMTERTTPKFVQDRATWALLGAVPGTFALAMTATGLLTLPAVLALAAVVVGMVAGWFYAIADLRSDAEKRRREFRHALATYLELVTILMAGGAGVESSLYDAAAIGRGFAFRQLRAALSAAQARREAPWTTLGVLGGRLRIVELQELEASMTLAGGGARVKDSLGAKAAAMRVKDLGQLEAEAEVRSETMVLPVAMMFAGFLLLIGYPALAGLSTT